jgi:hypothetical protein
MKYEELSLSAFPLNQNVVKIEGLVVKAGSKGSAMARFVKFPEVNDLEEV